MKKQRRTVDWTQVIKNLECGSPAEKIAGLSILSEHKNPNIEIGFSTIPEHLLSFCNDGDARVRAFALGCLFIWCDYEKSMPDNHAKRRKFEWVSDNVARIYSVACKLLTEDSSSVRQISLKTIYMLGFRFPKHMAPFEEMSINGALIEHASLDSYVPPKKSVLGLRRKKLNLIEDAFSRVCDRLQDPSRNVRQLSASLIADLAKIVDEDSLMSTLEKTVMSDRQVKRAAGDLCTRDKWASATRRGVLQKGCAPSQVITATGPVSVDAISLLSTGSCGAIINGLEDEFHEVRCATLSTVTQIASSNVRFASVCQDLLVDMLTDDIQSVRLRAVHALQAVGDQVPILNDQIAIVTSALAEDSPLIRQRLHQLLARCRLVSPPCLLSLLDGLLSNLRKYPSDQDSIWRCAASVGSRHPAFVEVCVSSLLRTHPWLSDQEPFREDPAYITVILLVLNALPEAPGMAAHFPRHLAASHAYLKELVPHMLQSVDTHFSFNWTPSIDLSLPTKRARFEDETTLKYCAPADYVNSLFKFLAASIVLVRRLISDAVCLLSQFDDECKSSTTKEPMEIDDTEVSSENEVVLRRLRECLSHLNRVISRELRICRLRDEHLGDLPLWLDFVSSAAGCLLSAILWSTASTDGKRLCSLQTDGNKRTSRFLYRAFRFSLKAEHLFTGLSASEIACLREFRCLTFSYLTESAVGARTMAYQAASVLIRLFDCLVNDSESIRTGEVGTGPTQYSLVIAGVSRAAERIHRVSVLLLQPPVSDIAGSLKTGQGADLLTSQVTLPEIRFTAILATAAVQIRALVSGLTIEQARKSIRVLYRRPDPSVTATTDSCHHRCPLSPWQPPPMAWRTVETISDTTGDPRAIIKRNHLHLESQRQPPQLELTTTLQITAPAWTSAGTLELGLGVCVESLVDGAPDTLLSLLPTGVMARVRLAPCGPAHRW